MTEKIQSIIDYIDAHEDEMLDFWQHLVSIPSGPGNKDGVDEVTGFIAKTLADNGFEKEIIAYENVGDLLVLSNGQFEKEVALIGHGDTVFKEVGEASRPFRIKDDKAYGPGVLDMKGGLTVATFALKALHAVGFDKPITFAVSGDEETAHTKSTCAEDLVEVLKGHKVAFNVETGFMDNGLVIGRKGGLIYNLEVEGVAAHTGNAPDKGRSAISDIARKIIEINGLTDLENGILYNVGSITGGIGPNTVPDKAKATIGVRYTKVKDKEKIDEALKAICDQVHIEGTKAKLTFGGMFNPMEAVEQNYTLFKHVESAAGLLGQTLAEPKMVGGASDSASAVMAGVPTVCAFGPRGEGNHTKDEYAVVSSLFERAKLLATAILTI